MMGKDAIFRMFSTKEIEELPSLGSQVVLKHNSPCQ